LAALRILFPQPRPIGTAEHETALAIAHRYSFAFHDSLIIASALEAGCATLWSEDMQDGQMIDGRLTIRNPFVSI
jgi:predicted nucleic acid-binding protein